MTSLPSRSVVPLFHVEPKLVFIPAWEIDDRWADVAPHLARPLARQSAMTLESLQASLLRGEMLLWEIPGKAAFVTQLQQFPAERICVIILCGGDGLREWQDAAWRGLTRYARKAGCSCLQIVGRRGWTRAVPEFQPTGEVILRAPL